MPTCLSSVSDRESQASLVTKLTKSYYQDDQQAKFMHLQAEVESLLQQLESLKHQRLAATSQEE
ncbi:hypothetical protein FACHB389_26895 [Nostoc calcicola FACHB-389]|uniref:Uncharacterized protein n=1 Tax=Desmonostoc muscorum LEGE 12446 TaxID=1828758 RepID=A0A8J6ZYS5_DESMC|nr:hypothetical protein [Desmonostoc muscorum]MBD2409345.1 hypothetical protein [Nostoc calcicola FACHB-3891]MCF2151699.1 hypothetical protein [Desmonostoc muscorum LEGE 12446]MDZ8057509.1 hypothetical protein [Nostoc sp. EkiNYC01]OKH29457.1 hypothetical protein FACHB389_26895 [Nostoc calcicola FACHB-389]